jgi:hypothetical protein
MYLPVPDGSADTALVERHLRHWIETGDFDEERQAGFWLYTAYKRALPKEYGFLADRIMNLEQAFPGDYEEQLRRCIRGILALTPDFDWEPYLARTAGEQKLSY